MVTLLALIFLINQVFKDNSIKVSTLNEDKAGGMTPLGRYSFRLTFLALIIGIHLVIFSYEVQNIHNLELFVIAIALSISYVLLVPFIFYSPLQAAHQSMLKCRRSMINEVAGQYDLTLHAALNDIENTELQEDVLEELDNLKKLEQHLRKMPIWPFNLQIQIGVIVNTIIPIVFSWLLNKFV